MPLEGGEVGTPMGTQQSPWCQVHDGTSLPKMTPQGSFKNADFCSAEPESLYDFLGKPGLQVPASHSVEVGSVQEGAQTPYAIQKT